MINKSVLKLLHVDSISDILDNDRVFSFALHASEDKREIEREAIYLARKMTGQLDWHGIEPEYRHYSGLATKANKWLSNQSSTTFRIKEVTRYGNGLSMYVIV